MLAYPVVVIAHLRRLLGRPIVYRAFSALIGAEAARRRFVRGHVRVADGGRVLDVGCGPADLLPHLPDVTYVGFDANPAYIEAARARHGARGTFRCARVHEEALDAHAGYDVVLASGLLHHLDDEEGERLFVLARRALRPGGRLVTLDGCYAEGQSPLARFLLSRDRGAHVRTADAYERLARRAFSDVRVTLREDLLRLPYTHVILECVRADVEG